MDATLDSPVVRELVSGGVRSESDHTFLRILENPTWTDSDSDLTCAVARSDRPTRTWVRLGPFGNFHIPTACTLGPCRTQCASTGAAVGPTRTERHTQGRCGTTTADTQGGCY